MKTHSVLTAAALAVVLTLSACGGGSGNAGTPGAPTPPTVTLTATANQTLAGGKTLPLTASSSDNSAVTWTLAAGSVGTLSAASGASVNYQPPATASANTAVTVNASAGGVSKSLTLTVFPDPGAPGLTILSGRLNSDLLDPPTDGPAASARYRDSRAVAADQSGNLYVAGACRLPSRVQGLTLRKISAAGIVSTLASCNDNSWFGASDSAGNLQKIYLPYGLAADRAGNLYTATYFFSATVGSASNDSRAVYKISPQGAMTLVAGAVGSHTADLKDGNGASARFLTPTVIGLDSDENLYLSDKDDSVLRKITPAAEVTTVSTLPASVNADLNGNTYRIDSSSGAIIRTTPAGVDSTIADVHTLPGVLSTMTELRPFGLVRTGPATYALVVSNGYYFSNEAIVQLVVAH
jgi:hypothetical protein